MRGDTVDAGASDAELGLIVTNYVENDYQTRYQPHAASKGLPVYICICNALTDVDINRAANQAGAARPAEVFAACKCRAQCGNCVRTVCAMLGLGTTEPPIATDAAHA